MEIYLVRQLGEPVSGEPVTQVKRFERPHHKLDVWNKAMELAKLTYRLTAGFPSEERYGLAQQMRRAAVSVVSNIAEGAARHSRKEFEQFLHIAKGSLSELDAQFELAASLGFTREPPMELSASVARMLAGLIRHLRNKSDSASPVHGFTGSRAHGLTTSRE